MKQLLLAASLIFSLTAAQADVITFDGASGGVVTNYKVPGYTEGDFSFLSVGNTDFGGESTIHHDR